MIQGEKTRLTVQNGALKQRLERLASSGMCGTNNVEKHVKNLKTLVKRTVDEKEVVLQSRILKALSDPLRLKILKLLRIREMCECEIMVALDLTQPTASHHLEILEEAGLVKSRREGKWVFFKLANPAILSSVEDLTSKTYITAARF